MVKTTIFNKNKKPSLLDLNQKMSVAEPMTYVNPPREVPKGEITKDVTTGKPSGIEVGGNIYYGKPEDINRVAEQQAIKNQPNTAELMLQQQQATQTAQQNQQLLQRAQSGLLTPEELQNISGAKLDVSQTLGAGAVSAAPGIVAGAVGGATIGALGGPVGAVGGAILGGVGAFLSGMKSNIKSQQTGEFSADRAALTKGERYLRSLITDTNQNPQNAPENIALFYQTLNMIDAAHAKTWKDSQEDLNRFLGNDGTPELAKFETFDNTMRQYYISQFETALAMPDPTRMMITAEDLGIEETE